MIRRIGSVLAGFVVFSVIVVACEALGARLFPIGAVDMNDESALRSAMSQLPAAAFLLVFAGWVVGSFLGGLTAALVSKRRSSALILGVAATVVGVINNLGVPPPAWFWALTLVAFLPPAWAASRLAVRPPTPQALPQA